MLEIRWLLGWTVQTWKASDQSAGRIYDSISDFVVTVGGKKLK